MTAHAHNLRPGKGPSPLPTALALAGVALAWLFFYWPVLFGPYSLHGDFQSLGYPFANLVAREAAQGKLALWDPWRATGYPFVGNPQTQVFYPPSLLLPLLLGQGKLSYYGLQWVTLLHCLWAGWGAFAYARALKLPNLACFMAGLAFALSGVLWGNSGHKSTMETIAWTPWVFWGLERLRSRPGLVSACLAALAAALMFLAGWTPGLFVCAPFFLAYYLAGVLGAPKKPRMLAWGGLAALFALGLVLAQLLPSLQLTGLSSRVQPDYGWSTEASLWPVDLLSLLAPLSRYTQHGFMFDEYYFYAGLPPLMLAGVALAGGRRRFAWLWLALAGVALFAALGKYTPFYRLIWETVPGAKYLRIPGRFVIVCQMAIAVLAALGAARLLSLEKGRPLAGLAGLSRLYLGVAVLGAAALPFVYFLSPAQLDSAGFSGRLFNHLALFLAFWLAGWLVLRLALAGKLGGVWAVSLLAALMLLELGLFPGQLMWGKVAATDRFPFSPELRFFKSQVPPGRASFDGPWEKPHLNIPNTSLVYQIPTPGINDTLDEIRHHELSACGNPRIYAELRGERYIVSGRSLAELPAAKYQAFELRPGESGTLYLDGLFQGPLNRLTLSTYLAYAGGAKQGREVAQLALYRGQKELARLPLLAGVHTAEWSHDKPGEHFPHRRPPLFSSFPVRKAKYQGHYYRAEWRFAPGLSPDRIELQRTGGSAYLKVDKILLNGRNLFALGQRYRHLGGHLFENLFQIPRAFAVHRWRLASRGEPALHATGLLGDFQKECVLEKAPQFPSPAGKPAAREQVRIVQSRADRVLVQADLSQKGVLLLIDTWYPGWRVLVNGQRRALLRADYAFRGVALAPGRNRVEFVYKPLAVRRGMAFSLATLAVMILCLCLAPLARRKRKKAKESEPK